jgi:hypothetical protein
MNARRPAWATAAQFSPGLKRVSGIGTAVVVVGGAGAAPVRHGIPPPVP